MVLTGLLCLTAMLLTQPALAGTPSIVELSGEAREYIELREHTRVLRDSDRDALPLEILARGDEFEPVTTPNMDFGMTDERIWLWVRLRSQAQRPGRWRLDMNRQYYESIEVYVRRDNSAIASLLSQTIGSPFSSRPVRDRMLGVDLDLVPGEVVDVLVGFTSDTTTYIPLAIGDVEAVLAEHSRENVINWVVNGALLSFMAVSLAFGIVIGWRLAISFAAYIASGFVYVFHADGYTFRYIWPEHMAINDQLSLSFMLLMGVFGLLFSRELFVFRRFAPRFDRVLIGFVAISAGLAVIAPWLHLSEVLTVLAYSAVPIGPVLQISAGLIAWREGRVGAKPYLVGAAFVFAAIGYATIAHTFPGWFDLDRTLDFGHLALVSEALAFAAAIGLRLIAMRREHENAVLAELSATQERLAVEKLLQKSNADYIAARRLSDKRRRELSAISHDLRQPLAALRRVSREIGKGDEAVSGQVQATLDYLEDLARDASAPSLAPLDPHLRVDTVSIAQLFQTLADMYGPEAQAARVELRLRPLPVAVKADAVSLLRAVSNLVTNAIDHAPNASVLLAARRRGARIRIEVHDTGQGMTSEETRAALLRRHKGPASKGEGLGLSIVQDIVEREGLDFTLVSRPGHGTSAFITVDELRPV